MADKGTGRLDKVRDKRRKHLNQDVADWQGVNADGILRAIAVVAYRGGALRFGYTRDGGAYAVGIYLGGDHFTEYIRPNEDIDGYLANLADDMQDA